MAIETYDQLQAAIIDWALPGGEPNFNAAVPSFIALAEARFDRELEKHNSIGVSTVKTSNAFPPVPLDWNEMITITELGGTPLKSMTIAQGEDLEAYGVGCPYAFAMVDGGFRLIPAPNAERTYRLTYYRELHRLSDTNQTNWLLDDAPDLYLFASLTAAEVYLKNDERLPVWGSAAQDIIEKMNMKSLRQEYSRGRPLVRSVTFG